MKFILAISFVALSMFSVAHAMDFQRDGEEFPAIAVLCPDGSFAAHKCLLCPDGKFHDNCQLGPGGEFGGTKLCPDGKFHASCGLCPNGKFGC